VKFLTPAGQGYPGVGFALKVVKGHYLPAYGPGDQSPAMWSCFVPQSRPSLTCKARKKWLGSSGT